MPLLKMLPFLNWVLFIKINALIFIQEACQLLQRDKIVIEERNHLVFKMKIDRFEEMLSIIAFKDKKIYPIRSFVTDIIGIEKITKSKALTKVMKDRQKERFQTIKEQNKEIKIVVNQKLFLLKNKKSREGFFLWVEVELPYSSLNIL